MSAEQTAGAEAGAAQAASAGVPATNAGADDYIQVPRSAIPDGDWHNALGRGKQYEALLDPWKKAGYQPEQLDLLVKEFVGGGQGQQPGQTGGYQVPPAPALSADQIRQMFNEALQQHAGLTKKQIQEELRNHSSEVQQQYQRSQAVYASDQATNDAHKQALKTWGHSENRADGTPNPLAGVLKRELRYAIMDAVDERLPKEMPPEGRRQAYETPTKEDIAKAVAALSWAKDMKYAMAAEVARQQETQPNVTLGAEAGGRQQKKWSEMSAEERKDHMPSLRGIDG